MEIKPIAYFRSPFSSKFGIPKQAGLVAELEGQIVFEPEFRNPDALRGMEGRSHGGTDECFRRTNRNPQ